MVVRTASVSALTCGGGQERLEVLILGEEVLLELLHFSELELDGGGLDLLLLGELPEARQPLLVLVPVADLVVVEAAQAIDLGLEIVTLGVRLARVALRLADLGRELADPVLVFADFGVHLLQVGRVRRRRADGDYGVGERVARGGWRHAVCVYSVLNAIRGNHF